MADLRSELAAATGAAHAAAEKLAAATQQGRDQLAAIQAQLEADQRRAAQDASTLQAQMAERHQRASDELAGLHTQLDAAKLQAAEDARSLQTHLHAAKLAKEAVVASQNCVTALQAQLTTLEAGATSTEGRWPPLALPSLRVHLPHFDLPLVPERARVATETDDQRRALQIQLAQLHGQLAEAQLQLTAKDTELAAQAAKGREQQKALDDVTALLTAAQETQARLDAMLQTSQTEGRAAQLQLQAVTATAAETLAALDGSKTTGAKLADALALEQRDHGDTRTALDTAQTALAAATQQKQAAEDLAVDLRAQLQEAATLREEIMSRIAQQEATTTEMQQALGRAQERLAAPCAMCRNYEVQLVTVHDSAKELRLHGQSLEQQLTRVRLDLVTANTNLTERTEEKRAITAVADGLRGDLETVRAQHAELRTDTDQLLQEHEAGMAQAQALALGAEQHVSALASKLDDVQQRLAVAEHDKAQLDHDIGSLTTKVRGLGIPF